jgi:hypothetical protein
MLKITNKVTYIGHHLAIVDTEKPAGRLINHKKRVTARNLILYLRQIFQIIVDTPGFINREATALELDDPFL